MSKKRILEHQPPMSQHAIARTQQRGVRRDVIALLMARCDVERLVGSGCTALSCSRAAVTKAREEGAAPSMVERLTGLVLVVAPDGTIVTVQNYETQFARFQRGHARLSARERARKAERRRRGGGQR